eukprot:6191942-Pyramimonas_sp.AAC.1
MPRADISSLQCIDVSEVSSLRIVSVAELPPTGSGGARHPESFSRPYESTRGRKHQRCSPRIIV